jgi:hypothetical protein
MAAKTTDPIDILLEMGIDLDNLSEEEDYLSALMEAASTIEFQTKGSGDERSTVLRKEILKLRKKRFAKARPEAKKTTIKPDAFFDKKKPEEQARPVPGQKALPGQQTAAIVKRQTISPEVFKKPEKPEQEEKKKRKVAKSDPLKDILRGINTIIAILNQQQKLSAKQAEKDRKRAEKEKREGAEDKLEDSGIKKFASGVDKIIKPVKGLLDGVFDFIKNVLIGTILIKIINWFTDPENKEKIEAIGEFFKATWPAILATFIAFKLRLGGFIVSLLGLVGKFVPKLLGLIPKMLSGLKTLAMGNPLATAAVAVVAGTAIAAVAANQKGTAVIEDPEDPDKSQADEIREFGGMTGAPMSADMLGFSSGGQVPGSGPNRDTVPAMLAPGEFVVSKGAVQKYGADTFAAMNAAGGGTNLPKRMNGVTYAAGGGLMGDYDLGEDKKEKQSAQVEKEMKDREKKNPIGDFFGGIGKALGFGGDDKETDKETPRKGKSEESSSSTLSETQQKALQVLAKYESGAAGYDAVNQIGTKGGRGVEGFSGDIKKMPQHEGRSLTDFTIAEIKQLQHDDRSMSNSEWIKAGKLHAVGAYQFIGNTLPGVASRAGIPDNAKFTPAVQDLMALQLMKERGISPWVGPSDKATAAERAIVEQARSEPIAYDKTSGGGAITAFGGGGGGGGYSSPSGTTMASLGGSGSGGSRPAGGGIATLFGNRTVTGGGSPSGTTMASLSKPFKAPPGPPPTPAPVGGSSGPATGGSQQGSSPNRSAKQIKNQNSFPDIDANAMISTEKVKVLGLTLA